MAYDAQMPDYLIALVALLLIVLIWRGPKMLPQWGAALGRGVREIRGHVDKTFGDEKTSELSDGGIETTTTTTTIRRDTTKAPRP